MSQYVWVEDERIDKNGIWLRVIKEDGERLLCEFKDPFKSDIYINKEDVLETTDEEIF